jgi:hypothetical protein
MVGAEAGRRDVLPDGHETGGAVGRRAWGSEAGETAGRQMRGLRASVRAPVDWCGDGVGRRGRLADWRPPLGRCPAPRGRWAWFAKRESMCA